MEKEANDLTGTIPGGTLSVRVHPDLLTYL
jgi:hypothetical protein